MERKGKIALILILCLLILGAAVFFLCSRFLLIGGKFYSVNAQTLDFSDVRLESVDKLFRLNQPQQLDLRGTGITTADYTALRQAYPQCDITWEVPFQGSYLPADASTVAVKAYTEADLEALAFFPNLQTIDATGCADATMIARLQTQFPQCTVQYRLTWADTQADETTTRLVLSSADHIAEALQAMPQLEEVDATGCTDTAALRALQQQYPDCQLIYQLTLGDAVLRTDAQSLDLSSATAAELAQVLPCFYDLQSVTLREPMDDYRELPALEQQYPNIAFTYAFDLLGVTVTNRDTLIDLSGIPMENTETLEAALPYFHNLEKVEMTGCGISNEDMAALNQRHPDTLFVWTVKIGRIKVKTDVTWFMPNQYYVGIHDDDTENLKYLTELICLDLGHQDISRTDYLAYMTKLQYLVIVDTEISDISGCANMPDLKFVELYLNNVTDFSPLLQCKKLEDLNIGYCHPDDWTIFCEMKQLTRIYWSGMHYSERQQALREALPNTILSFDSYSSTGDGWRESPNYFAMRDLLGMPYMTY